MWSAPVFACILESPMKKHIRISRIIAACTLALCLGTQTLPASAKEQQALPIPRFVTLGADEVNLRTGPGTRYPIRLVVKRDGLPVEIIREFDVWRQVRDKDGDEGWVHKSMLSGARTIIVTCAVQTVYKKPDDTTRPVVRLEPNVVAGLEECKDAWCRISIGGYEGWIRRTSIWGVYADENIGD